MSDSSLIIQKIILTISYFYGTLVTCQRKILEIQLHRGRLVIISFATSYYDAVCIIKPVNEYQNYTHEE